MSRDSKLSAKLEVTQGAASLHGKVNLKSMTVTVKLDGLEAESFRNWCAMQGINSPTGAKIIWTKGWCKNFGILYTGL